MGDAKRHDPIGRSTRDVRASNVIVPADGRRRPETVRRVVVLPAPFEPISATSSPWATVSEMPWRARIVP